MKDVKWQMQNLEKTHRVLRTRLYDLKRAEQQEKIGAQRRTMVGTGGRSEKIRPYNFKEKRVTDHRIKLTLHKLDQVTAGGPYGAPFGPLTAARARPPWGPPGDLSLWGRRVGGGTST